VRRAERAVGFRIAILVALPAAVTAATLLMHPNLSLLGLDSSSAHPNPWCDIDLTREAPPFSVDYS
jgi:hypothetical protein